MTYLDNQGKAQNPIMGCYGIGVGRLAASICEESHDDYGPIWPMPIAPWQVEICNLKAKDERVSAACEGLYSELTNMGVEVLYDDRPVRPGFMFADADLFGVPVRVVVSPKTLDRNCYEISYRDKSYKGDLPVENAAAEIKNMVQSMLDQYKF